MASRRLGTPGLSNNARWLGGPVPKGRAADREADGARLIDIIRRAWRQHQQLARGGRPLSEMDASRGGVSVPVEGKVSDGGVIDE